MPPSMAPFMHPKTLLPVVVLVIPISKIALNIVRQLNVNNVQMVIISTVKTLRVHSIK